MPDKCSYYKKRNKNLSIKKYGGGNKNKLLSLSEAVLEYGLDCVPMEKWKIKEHSIITVVVIL